MTHKKLSRKTVWAISGAVFLVVALLLAFFMAQSSSAKRDAIVLPSQDTPTTDQEHTPSGDQNQQQSDYYEVTASNVRTVLQSLNRPTAYHQRYTVTVGADETQAVRQVELWRNGSYLHAEVADEQQVCSIISNGETAYLWYDGEDSWLEIALSDRTQAEDLLGLPDFDAYLNIRQDTVADAGYLVLEDSAVQCIYVCTQDAISDTSRFWVNLENGLLYQADVLENSHQVYSIRQTAFEMLAVEDQSFSDRFLLPDGSAPFIAAREVQQP